MTALLKSHEYAADQVPRGLFMLSGWIRIQLSLAFLAGYLQALNDQRKVI